MTRMFLEATRHRRVSIFAVVGLVLSMGCGPAPTKEKDDAPEKGNVSSEPVVSKGTPDLIYNTWVCVADNGSGMNGSTFVFKKDGTATVTIKGKPTSARFKVQPSKDFYARSGANEEMKSSEVYKQMTKDTMWAISFADPQTGQFLDAMPPRLFMDADARSIFAPLTEAWVIKGEEKAYAERTRDPEREKAVAQREQDLKVYKPEKDVTTRWKQVWSTALPAPERAICSMPTGDLDGDGRPEIVVPDRNGFSILDADGKILKSVPTPDTDGRYFAVGRRAGKGLVCQFRTWGDQLQAYDLSGKKAWTATPGGQVGIQWAAPVELDAGNTGFVLGITGGGAQFLGPEGDVRWSASIKGNNWNVAGAKVGKGQPGVALCVGPVAYDTKGKEVRQFDDPRGECVGSADLDSDGRDEVLSLGTTQGSGGMVTAFRFDGQKLWTAKASGVDVAFLNGTPFVSGQFGGTRLVGVGNGMTVRFFRSNGELYGDYVDRGGIYAIASVSGRLVVRHGNAVVAYELRS